MRVPKSLKKEPNDRPLRPKTGVRSDEKVLHLSWASFEAEEDEWEERIRIDADENEEFYHALRREIPKADCVWCKDTEVWFLTPSYKDKVLEIAEKHFDTIKKDLRKWKT